MDDGTWHRQGDKCLPGLLKLGTVIEHHRAEHTVKWDDARYGTQRGLLAHGLRVVTLNE